MLSGRNYKRPSGRLAPLTLLIILSLAGSPDTMAQEYYSTRSIVVEDLIEKIARESDEELDYQTLFDDIYKYLENPLNINAATKEELESLQLLTDFQVLSLQNYIRENGPLLSIFELPLVYGFSEALARTLEPLVFCGPPERALPTKPKSSHQLWVFSSAVLEPQRGYYNFSDSAKAAAPNSYYQGNRLRLMTKYRYKYGNRIHAGYNGDKDAGEPFFRGKNKYGFDFNSAYFRFNDAWKFKSIIAGDFQVKTGQGLALWSGLAFGKSPDIINLRRKGNILNQYTSVDENRFLRGISATAAFGNIDFTAFLSHKRVDANTHEDTIAGTRIYSAFQNSGYHRSANEIEDKDAVRETLAGGNITWNADRFRLGATFLHYMTDIPPGNSGYPTAAGPRSNSNASMDYTIALNRLSLFGEAAYSFNTVYIGLDDKWAVLNGASFQAHPRVYLSVLQRYLGAGYQARYGNAFRENSRNTNENGIYMGTEILLFPGWKLSAYLDAYQFPFLKQLGTEYQSGFDYQLQADYSDRDRLNGYLRYRYKKKPDWINPYGSGSILHQPFGSQLRFHITYRISEALVFQNRLELSFYNKDSRENGWLAYHDIIYKPASLPLGFSFRYAMFDTDSYASRIYTYEHDILYQFAIPSWHGRGIRTYLNARWRIGNRTDLWLKYSLSWYPDRETIGSGLSEIKGHHRQDLKIQLRLKF